MNKLTYLIVIACLSGMPVLLTGCEDVDVEPLDNEQVDVEPLDNEQVDETPADTDDQVQTPAETAPPVHDTVIPGEPGMPPPPQ